MTETIESAVTGFLEHKRAIGRKYHSEEAELRLLVRFARDHGADRLDRLTPALVDDFLASRPRSRPRSFNHLLGAVNGLLQWAVTGELIQAWPAQTRRRRAGRRSRSCSTWPRPAGCWMPPEPCLTTPGRCTGGRPTGLSSHCATASGCGPGRPAGSGSAMSTGRQLLVVLGGKFGKGRLVPHGPRIVAVVAGQPRRRQAQGASRCRRAPVQLRRPTPVNPCTASQVFHHLIPALDLMVPNGVSRRACTACVTLSRWRACCAGTAKGRPHRRLFRPSHSWAMSARCPPPST